MNHLIAPSSSGIEAARPQSTIVRERGRALITDACRGRRDIPSVGSVNGPSRVRGATGEMRRKPTFRSSPRNGDPKQIFLSRERLKQRTKELEKPLAQAEWRSGV